MTLNEFVTIGIMRALINATKTPKRNKHQRMKHREYMRGYMRKRRAKLTRP